MNFKSKASIPVGTYVAIFSLIVAIHGDWRAGKAEDKAAAAQQESESNTLVYREHQGVNDLAGDARKMTPYRVGSAVHLENRSDGAARHIYITWPGVGSEQKVVQAVPDLPRCYEYVLPVQGRVKTAADGVPDVYWTDLTGLPWTRVDGELDNPAGSQPGELHEPQQPSNAVFVNMQVHHLDDC